MMADENFYSDYFASKSAGAPTPPEEQTTADPFYSDFFAKKAEGNRTRLRQTLGVVLKDTPEQMATDKALSDKTGLPVPVIQRDRENVAMQQRLRELQQLAEDSPILARQMQDPVFAGMAHDSAENLSAIERHLTGPVRALGAGLATDFNAAAWGWAEGGARLVGADTLGGFFNELRKGQEARGKRIQGDYGTQGLGEAGVALGFRSFGAMLPNMIASVLTGNPSFMLNIGAATAGGQAVGKGLDKGLEPWRALAYGAEDAVAERVTEMIPVGRLFKDLKAGTPFFKLLGMQMATEVPTELAATTWQNFNAWANLNPEKSFEDYANELGPDLAQTVIATMTQTILSAGMAKGASKLAQGVYEHQQKAQEAEQDAAALAQLSQLAAASKLRARDPQSFQDFIEAANEDGSVRDIYLDARTLQQAGIDPALLAQASPAVAAQLEEALATGGDLVIPMAEYAARIAGTDLDPVLTPHLRTSEDALSLNEAQTFYQGQAEEFQKAAAQVMEEKASDAAWTASAKAVENNLFEQMQEAGRFTDDVNTAYATLMRDFYVATASRLGITPEEMFARYPLKVAAERLAGGAQRMEQEQGDRFVYNGWVYFRPGAEVAQSSYPGQPAKVVEVQEKGNGEETLYRLEIDVRGHPEGLDENGERVDKKHSWVRADELNRLNPPNVGAGDTVLAQPGVANAKDSAYTADRGDNNELDFTTDRPGLRADQEPRTIGGGAPRVGWVEQTRVRSKSGKPVLAYRGAGRSLDTGDFGRDALGYATGRPSSGLGVWFTLDRDEAGRYAGETGQVEQFHLDFRNPFVVKVEDLPGFDSVDEAIAYREALRAQGHDGIALDARSVGGPVQFIAFDTETVIRPPAPKPLDMGQFFQSQQAVDQTETPEFEAWAGTDREVIEPDEINDFDFGQQGPFVVRGFHGTTNTFDEFNAGVKGNVEGQFGAVNYFTSSRQDAGDNYAGEGPDLTNRIEQKAEPLADEIQDLYDEVEAEEGEEAAVQAVKDRYGEEFYSEKTIEMARSIVRQELHGGDEIVMEVFIKTEKPFVVGDVNSPWMEFFDEAALEAQAIARVADSNDVTVEEVEADFDEYGDQINDARYEIMDEEGNAVVKAVQTVADRYDFDPSDLLAELYDMAADGSVRHNRLEEFMRQSESLVYAERPDDGALVQSQMIGEIIQELGFDAIILKNANVRFKNMNMERGTAHIHVFDTNNTNIKSVDNQGTFDANDPNIYRQPNGWGTAETGDPSSPDPLKPGAGSRGTISFGADITKAPSVISLLKNADLSTFLHEMGHFQLEVLAHIASQPNAPAEIVADFEAVLKWFGITGDSSVEGGETAGSLGQPPTGEFIRNAGPRIVSTSSLSDDFKSYFSAYLEPRDKHIPVRMLESAIKTLERRVSELQKPFRNERELWLKYATPEEEADFAKLTPERMTELLNMGVLPTSEEQWQTMQAQVAAERAKYQALLDEAKTLHETLGPEVKFETGKPVTARVFHGSESARIAEEGFNKDKLGSATGAASARMGFFFAGRPDTSNTYAGRPEDFVIKMISERERQEMLDYEAESIPPVEEVEHTDEDGYTETRYLFNGEEYDSDVMLERAKEEYVLDRLRNNDYAAELYAEMFDKDAPELATPVVYPARVHMQNPYVHDYQGEQYREVSYAEIISRAKKAGHDGVILLNTYDGGPLDNIFVVFDEDRIEHTLYQGDQPAAPDPSNLPKRRTALEVWQAMSLEEKRPYHEQFARGFEAYLFEGKAPNPELNGLFARFRAWLVNVYKSVKALNVEISDDIRQVFDRMVATEEAIKQAEAMRGMTPTIPGTEEISAEATQDAIDTLQRRSLRDMRWLDNARGRLLKQMQKDAAAKRKAVEAEVRREVWAMPVYQAWQFLTAKENLEPVPPTPKEKAAKGLDPTRDTLLDAIAKLGGMNREAVVSEWGTDLADVGRPAIFGKPVLRKDGGLSVDGMAETLAQYGYITLDEDGKWDLREFEEKFGNALGGSPEYSSQADYDFLQGSDGPTPDDLALRNGGRLDLAAVRAAVGKDSALEARRMTRVGGLDPDTVAEMINISTGQSAFTSGDHLIKELVNAQRPRDVIEGMTDQRVLERYGDLSSPDVLARAVDEAIHNEARARFVATELKAISQAVGPVRAMMKAAKDFAAATLARKKVKDIKPNQHATAETRAAKAAEKAMKAGDTLAAAVEKRNQLVQNYSTRLSYDALTEIDKAVKYLRKFDSEGTRKNLDAEYVDQIDQLLERFDLRASVSNKAADKRANLLAWVESQREQGFEPDIPPELLTEALRKPYKELTLEELRGLVDTVKQIEHLGRLKHKLLTAKDEREFKAIRDEIAASIEANAKGTRELRTRETTGALLAKAGNGFLAMHRKMASVAREMDGFADGGPMWEYFIHSMNDAGNRETTMRAEATARLHELVKPLLAGGKMGGKGLYFPTLGLSLNREERIAIALNLGNAGNMQRLLDGQGWTMDRLQPVLDSITPEEADFAQAVWDFFESYRPEIGAKERRIYGKEPEWVEPVPVMLGGKMRRGGYYPIKYDPAASGRAEQHAEAEAARAQMRGAYTTATTRRSFTKGRAEEVTGRPLLYSFAGLYQGTNEVIHDLAWHEWLIDANRLLRSLDGPIRSHYGPETVSIFKKAIEDIAQGDVPAQNVFERGLNHVRTGATIAGLGWNLTTSLLQPLGLTQSMVRIGPGWVAKGLGQWIKAPLDTLTEINAKSPMMASRAQTMQREINEIQNQVRGSKLDPVRSTFFVLIQKMQMVADVPTWLGAYEKAIAAGEAEERAVALADQAVLDAQGGGQMKDLAQIQRGHPGFKLFTNFYSFFNVAYNLGVEKTKQKITQPKLYPSLALDYLLLYSVPAVLGLLMKEALKGGDDDEDLADKIIAEQISFLLGLMVGVREVTAGVQKLAGVEQFKTSYGGPAGLRLFQEIDKLGQQLGQGDADMALFKAANNVGGIVFHYPSGQVNRTAEGVAAMAEGKTANPLALVVGPPKN